MTDTIDLRFPVGRRVQCEDRIGKVIHASPRVVAVDFGDPHLPIPFTADFFREHPDGLRLVSRLVPEGREGD